MEGSAPKRGKDGAVGRTYMGRWDFISRGAWGRLLREGDIEVEIWRMGGIERGRSPGKRKEGALGWGTSLGMSLAVPQKGKAAV